MIKKLGKELDSHNHWEEVGHEYADALENEYHRHRLSVIRALIPTELYRQDRRIFDFGCGDAVLFPPLLQAGSDVRGVDISESMIALARERLRCAGHDPDAVRVAGSAAIRELETASLDAVMCFNVLAYLSENEERTFYEEVSRTVKPGGHLIVTHSNELFDLFSLNRYTVEFMRERLVDPAYRDGIAGLLRCAAVPELPTAYNIRENPLTYRHKLDQYGFLELRQEFINRHPAPPPLLRDREYPNTLDLPVDEKWKLLFTCSTFGSLSVRV